MIPTGGPRGGPVRLPAQLGGALAGGVLTGLAFPPVGAVPLILVGPAVGLWAAAAHRPRRGALAGLAYGVGFSFTTFAWLLSLDLVAYAVFAPLQAVFFPLIGGVAAAAASRLGPGWWTTTTAAAWTLTAALRARAPLSGFEWGQLGLATADVPLRHATATVGSLGLTGLLAAVAAGLAALVLWRERRPWRPLVAAVTALVIVTGVGAAPWTTPTGTLEVAVVQVTDPCPDAFAVDCPGYASQLLQQYVDGTAALAGDPDVVVWGEDALPGGESLAVVGGRLADVAQALPAPVLAGSTTFVDPGRFVRWNALYDTDGTPMDTYAKRVPVPFGEYVPLRDVLGGISDVGRLVPSDMLPGDSSAPVVVPTDDGPAPLGTVVSWEVTFSRLVRDVARDAEGLATLTTVASYGTGSVSEQLLAAAQIRAAEHRKPMVVSATTGRSAIIAADGTRRGTSALFAADTLEAEVRLHAGLTPFARFGEVPVIALAAIIVAGALLRGRRRAHDAAPAAGEQTDGSRGGALTGPVG